jgi:hypothetical protein
VSWGRRRRPGQKRAKKPVVPAAVIAWRCVVLAIDTAARSGWAVAAEDKLLAFGEADTLDDEALAEITRWATARAAKLGMPCVLVLEAPWGGPVTTVLALGQARERWLHAWRQGGQSRKRVVSVRPATWRGPVLGRYYVSAPRDVVREQEQLVASAMAGETARADEAPAICIAHWGAHARQVGAVMGKRAAVSGRRVA